MLFAPTDIDITITPQAVLAAISKQEYGLALNMALHLGERNVLKKAVDAIDLLNIDLVVLSVDIRMLKEMLSFIAEELTSSPHIEYYLQWSYSILQNYHTLIFKESIVYLETLRNLLRVITQHEKDFMNNCDKNQYVISFIEKQIKLNGNGMVEELIENYDVDGESVDM